MQPRENSPPSAIRVRSAVDGFRRADMRHPGGSQDYALDHFHPDQLDTDQWMAAAKAMGAKFSFGSNNFDDKAKDLSRWFEAIALLDLRPADLAVPKKP